MNNNGQVPIVHEEIVVDLTIHTAVRIVALKARQEIAHDIFNRLMSLYKELGDKEQYALDMTITSLCETSGRTLPHPYEYMLDVDAMKLIVRQKEQTDGG
jgi:hypothetical protein